MAYVLLWDTVPPKPRARLSVGTHTLSAYTLEAHPAVARIAGRRKKYDRDFAPVSPASEGMYAISQRVLGILLALCPSQITYKPIDVRRIDGEPGIVPMPIYWLLLNQARESLVLPEEYDGDPLKVIRKERYDWGDGMPYTRYTRNFYSLLPDIGRKQELRKRDIGDAHIWFERLNGSVNRDYIFASDDLADILRRADIKGPDHFGRIDEI